MTIQAKVVAVMAGTTLLASWPQLVIAILLVILAIILAVKGSKTVMNITKNKKAKKQAA